MVSFQCEVGHKSIVYQAVAILVLTRDDFRDAEMCSGKRSWIPTNSAAMMLSTPALIA